MVLLQLTLLGNNWQPVNLTVKLQGEDGIYWGCHSWWKPKDYAVFSDADLRAQIVPTEVAPALEFLYERLMLDGDAQENWQSALSELGLILVEHSMD